MGSHNHGASSGAELSNGAPLLTVNGKPVENGVVDAGLKSLDHCTYKSWHCVPVGWNHWAIWLIASVPSRATLRPSNPAMFSCLSCAPIELHLDRVPNVFEPQTDHGDQTRERFQNGDTTYDNDYSLSSAGKPHT